MKEHKVRSAPGPGRAAALAPAAVALSTVLVFSISLRNGFLNWDDNAYILGNPHYRVLDWTNLRWMFAAQKGAYDPLVWLLFSLTHALGGMDPLAYHLAGVLVHAAVAALLYSTTVRLLRSAGLGREKGSDAALRWSAAAGALLFALHPLRVEAVAWASAQHYTLASFFFLASIRSYLEWRAAAAPAPRWLALSFAGYALCVLSGPIGVTLPLVLLILDWSLPKRAGAVPGPSDLWREHREKIIFLLLSVSGGIAAIKTRRNFASLAGHGVAARVAQAAFGAVFYLRKTLAPWGLSPLYPLPRRLDPLAWPFLLSGAAAIGITVAVLALRRRRPSGLAVWTYYLVTVSPVLGFAQVGPHIAADRYSYLPCMGFSVLAAGALARFWNESGPRARRGAVVLTGALLAALSVLTWRQLEVWHDSESLWRQALAVDPGNLAARNSLGAALFEKGKVAQAIEQYDLELQASPDDAWTHNNLGLALAAQGKADEAIRHYDRALQIQPDYAQAHYDRALALAGQGRLDEAAAEYRLTLQIQPDDAEARNNLGKILARQGKLDESIRQFELALQTSPDDAAALNNLGLALAGQGRLDEAIRRYASALAVGSAQETPFIHNNLGTALAQQGKNDEAIEHFRRALLLKPDFAAARENLSAVLQRAKSPVE